MKTLLIMRHGKSSWDDPLLNDFDRPLLKKGQLRTQMIAEFMAEQQLSPELIISSPAVRAYETAVIVADAFGYSTDTISMNSDLYFVDTDKYSEAVYGVSDEINTLMIVGHNPMITEFCNMFLAETIDNLPTSGLCAVRLDTGSWTEIHSCKSTVSHLMFPKKLGQL
jgi:phosphohistidine phosphatase